MLAPLWAESVAHVSRRARRMLHGGIKLRLVHPGAARTRARRSLMPLLPHFDFVEPVGALEDFARLAAVGRADDAVALHAIQNARGASVAEAQMTLQGGSGCLAHLQHEAHGVLVCRVLVLAG